MNLSRREQILDLVPPLEITHPHMNVENVEGAESGFEVGTDTPSSRMMRPRQIHTVPCEDRPPAKQRVSVWPSTMVPRAAKDEIHFERGGQRFHLTFLRFRIRKNFLQCDDVGIQFGEHVSYSLDGHTAVHSAAFMDVVRNDTH